MTAAEKRDIQCQWYRQNHVRDGHRRGWSFTPLVDYKRPSTPGWSTAPRETEEQAGAWAKVGNVGLRTGKASGIVVIDVDGEPGETTEQIDARADALGLPPTVTVRTGGGGLHFYFKAPDVPVKNSRGVIAPHVDVRSDGGQVVFPGSIHASGNPYFFCQGLNPNDIEPAGFPLWIIPEPKPYEPPPRLPVARTSAYERCQRYIECLPDAISGSGGHDATFEAACTCFRFGLDEAQVQNLMQDFNATKCQPPWTPRELAHKIQSARDTVTAAGQFGCKLAEDRPPPPSRAASASSGATLVEWKPCNIAHWFDVAPPPRNYIIKDCLALGDVGLLIAAGGTGKTWLLLQLGLSVASGKTLLSSFAPTRAARVLFLSGEDDEHVLWSRTRCVPGLFRSEDLIAKNLRVYAGRSEPLVVANSEGINHTPRWAWLKQEVEVFGPEFVIIDPKARFDGTDEDDSYSATAFVVALQEVIGTSAALLLAHHIRKSSKGELDSDAARGSSALRDAVRWAATMASMDKAEAEKAGAPKAVDRRYVKVDVCKSNYSPGFAKPLYLERGPGGVLSEANFRQAKREALVDFVAHWMVDLDEELNLRDLNQRRSKEGKRLAEDATLKFPKATKRDITEALDEAVAQGRLILRIEGRNETFIRAPFAAEGPDTEGQRPDTI